MAEKSSTHNGVPKGLILLTVIIGTFLGRLDQTIVDLALPKIITDFHISVSHAGWIATAYIIANAVFVPVWGKLGDRWGRKKVYVIGFSLFIVGSVLAGLAWDLGSMIVFRIIQAVAGSADYPTAMSIIAFTYTDEKERAQALGTWSSSFAVAAVFGPLIGGALVDNFGWRSVFLVNLPIGLIGLLMALSFIHESKSDKPQGKGFDFVGAGVLGIALSTLVLVLDQGLSWGWLSLKSIACYIATIISTLVFIHVEKRHPDPVVDLKFFKNNIFVQVLTNNFLIFMGLMGCIYLIPIFAQIYMGYDATSTGYLFLPMAIALMVAARVGATLTGKVEARYVIMFSTFVAGVGFSLFRFIDPRSGPMAIALPMTLMAGGMGFGMAQRTNIVASAVPKSEIGIASSVLALARNIAGAFGISVFATVLNYATNSAVLRIARFSTYHGTTDLDYMRYVALIELKAKVIGYHAVFVYASLLVIMGAFLAYYIKADTQKGVEVHVE